jgi:DNA-directed RNA polymerase sigma subunit (sigma70/sigma32)
MEIWKDVRGFEDYYEVSNFSNIRRKKGSSHLKQVNLKGSFDKDGYIKVNLKIKQKTNSKMLHRLIAEAFIPNPENKTQVNHLNGIKDDNVLENLEWCTLSENRQHAYDTGLQNGLTRRGAQNNFSKLENKDVLAIRMKYNKKQGRTMKVLSEEFNVSSGCIQRILSKNSWAWLK